MVLPKVHTLPFLLPIAWIYDWVMAVRNWAFENGHLPVTSFEDQVAVIGIGNVVAGGAGKTPHIEYLIRLLQREGVGPIAVLSRGYKRETKGFLKAAPGVTARQLGDESYQLFRKFPDVIVAVDEKRVDGIRNLLSSDNPPKVILLDDCFQHRYVKPGLTICLSSYHRILYRDSVLPAGLLRENPKGIRRANLVVITKCPDSLRDEEETEIIAHMPTELSQPILYSGYKYGQLVNLVTLKPTKVDPRTDVLVVSGIADPSVMISYIGKRFRLLDHMAFGDHHRFSNKDIQKIRERLDGVNAQGNVTQIKGLEPIVIVTEKDAARLLDHKAVSEELKKRIYYLPTEVFFLKDHENQFNKIVLDYVRKDR
ncbi:MAG: tetraacyldisaccharide 4'-kinase [Bacteroidales bacterium]|nr:tetraacyldisaccharide 4'-kinase [Bacteroidales bacterium]